MSKFALITHLLSIDSELNYLFYPSLKILNRFCSQRSIKNIIKNLPAHKMSYVKKIVSISDNETSGWVIVCPLLPEHFRMLKEEFVIKKIVSSCNLAKKLGADIVGLAAFTSIVGNEGEEVSKKVNLAVTSGNTYTACLAIEGILKAADYLDAILSESTLCIVGASGDIGSICAQVLSKKFKRTFLIGRNKDKLIDLAGMMKGDGVRREIIIETSIKQVIPNADFILCAASSIFPLFETSDLKSGTVVCDVSFPQAVPKNQDSFREDVLVFDGGKAKVNYKNMIFNSEWQQLFPDDVIYGCFAETILLAFEERVDSFSLGRGNITEAKIIMISDLAKKHGFETAPLKFGTYVYTDEDIARVKRIRSDLKKEV